MCCVPSGMHSCKLLITTYMRKYKSPKISKIEIPKYSISLYPNCIACQGHVKCLLQILLCPILQFCFQIVSGGVKGLRIDTSGLPPL